MNNCEIGSKISQFTFGGGGGFVKLTLPNDLEL